MKKTLRQHIEGFTENKKGVYYVLIYSTNHQLEHLPKIAFEKSIQHTINLMLVNNKEEMLNNELKEINNDDILRIDIDDFDYKDIQRLFKINSYPCIFEFTNGDLSDFASDLVYIERN